MDFSKKRAATTVVKTAETCNLSRSTCHDAANSEETDISTCTDSDLTRDGMDVKVKFRFYNDWSELTPEDVKNRLNGEQDSSFIPPPFLLSSVQDKLFSSYTNKRQTYLPTKLHQMLSDPELEATISWLPHGRAWKIRSIQSFENIALKKYFPQCKLSSFMRLVNRWHFERVKYGPDKDGYYHEV